MNMAPPMESLALPADVRRWLACDYQLGLEQNSVDFTKHCQQTKRKAFEDWVVVFANLDFTKMTTFELSVRLMRTIELLGNSGMSTSLKSLSSLHLQ
jgi:hypothetical protein